MEFFHPVNRRWYHAEVGTDLFGTVGVHTHWGGAGRAGSRTKFHPAASTLDASKILSQVTRRRLQHGYLPRSG